MADELDLSRQSRRNAPNISALNNDVQAKDHEADIGARDGVVPLVERAKRGDRDAFGEIYRRFHALLFRTARLHVGEAAAEDVVAETFLRAWTGLSRYRDMGVPFIAWLYGIQRHVLQDEFAKVRRMRPVSELPDRAGEHAMDDRLSLAAAIDRLPDEQRQVVELKFLVGLTNSEVAAALGKSEGAVNAKQWRALETLRTILGET